MGEERLMRKMGEESLMSKMEEQDMNGRLRGHPKGRWKEGAKDSVE